MADYSIQLGVKVNTKDIDTAINKYQGKPIEVKSKLDTSGIDKKIASYKVKKPIEINTKLNTSGLAKKIGEYKPKTPIKLNAKLDTKNISAAIKGYKAPPIKVDIKLDSSDISKQIRAYKANTPIKVGVKLDNNDITKQIRAYQTKTPIKLGVKLTTKDIDEKIRNYRAKTPIKLDVKINKSVINEQIKSFNPKNTIKLKAALQKGAIAEEIRKYKPNTPIKVDLELNYSDIDKKVGEYIATKGAVELPVKLRPATKGFSDSVTKKPIKVSAMLETDDINKVIDNFKATSKIKVDVKLNPKDISAQIQKLPKPTEPLSVDVDLNENSINSAIAAFKPASKLKVHPDLVLEDIDNQINAYVPKSKVKVNIDLNDIGAEAGKQNAQPPITVNAKLDRDDINTQIKNFKTNSKIKVGVKLDFASHKDDAGNEIQKGISKQIKEFETKTKVKIGVQLDRDSIKQEVQNIKVNTPIQVGVELDPDGIKNIQNQINTLKQQIQALGNIQINLGGSGSGSGSNVSNAASSANKALREVYDLYKQIESMELKLGKLKLSGVDSGNITEYRTKLDNLRKTYENLFATMSGKNGAINLDSVFVDIDKAKTLIKELLSSFDNARTKLSEDIKLDIKAGKLKGEINRVKESFNLLNVESQKVTDGINKLENLLGRMDTSDDIESVTSDYQEFLQLLKTVKNSVNELQNTQSNSSEMLDLKKASAMEKLNNMFEDGSQAARRFGERARQLKEELNNCGNANIGNVTKKVQILGDEVKRSGLQTKTFTSRLKDQFSKYSSYISIASVFMYAEQGLRSMFEQVKLIDSAMTELKKVTDESDASYNQFLSNAATKAKEIGTTIDGLVSSTADFARLGYDFADAQGLAEVANIYAVVGDEIDGVEDATQNLISTLAAFKDEMGDMDNSEFALSIVDKMNEVANNYAISSGGLGEALQRSASSMAAANNTLDETIAMITAANEVAQDPEKVGNAMKTISMRIRGATTELEEAGESTDGMAESTAKLREEILALSGVDIMLNERTFKSTYQIMDELSQKWEGLSDIAQASITELMAGKHQGNIMSSLMSNFDTARNALETSLNSSGSAMAEHAKWSQSLEAQLLKLKAAWQGLSQSFLSSDFLKVALNAVISLVDGLTKLVDTLGVFPTLLGSFAGLKVLFTILKSGGISGIKSFGDVLTALQLAFPNVSAGASKLAAALKGMAGASADANIGILGLLKGLLATHPYIAGAVIAIGALTGAFIYQKKKAEELAKEVDETVSSYKEQHNELKKLKNDYDTSNEDSMISKYKKLSKGVGSFNENVSLTADEYAEYQDIVNTIAEQIPSLVSGFDSQGNAILSCAGNVQQLTEEYEKLIHAQNQDVLVNSGKFEQDFTNTIEKQSGTHWWTNGHGFWKAFDFFKFADYELKDDTVGSLSDLLNAKTEEQRSQILDGLRSLPSSTYSAAEIRTALEGAGVDIKWYENVYDVLEKTLETDPQKIRGIVDNYYTQFAELVEQQKTIAQAKLSEAFDISNAISGLNYGNIGEGLQNIAYQTVNSLDYNFFKTLNESGKTVEQWTTEMLSQLNAISEVDNAKIEAGFDLKTKFNGGEISYGEYVGNLRNLESIIDGLTLKDETKKQLKISLGLDENGIVDQYDALFERLTKIKVGRNGATRRLLSDSGAKELLDSLSSEELYILNTKVIPEIDGNATREQIEAAIQREMVIQGLNFDLNLEVESAGIESLNTALSESVTASGLSSESISALKSRYADLESQGYDLSSMFEETSHGIHLNRNELSKFENELSKQKLAEVDSDLAEMKATYDELGEAIKNCEDPIEKSKLFDDRQSLAQKISEAAILASQYKGLTSAYNDWLAAEEAGNERDMYENVISGFETVKDELSRGWADDSTVEFLEMITGKTDLAGKSGKELKEVYDSLDDTIKHTTHSVRDFFTVDDEGNSTSKGVYNFLDAVGQLEEEAFGGKDIVKRDKKGNIIGFDFELAGGDEVIAEALGISEELVQIMVRAADDAGFVVSMDGTYKQLADLQNEAKAAADYLKEIGKTDFEFNFNTSSVSDLKDQLVEAKKIWKDKSFWNTDGTFNFDADGATEAMQIVSTLQAKIDNLTQEQYGIGLTVEDDKYEGALESLQDYGHTVAALNQLELNPKANAEEINKLEADLDTYAQELNNLPDDVKVEIGLVGEDGKTPLNDVEAIKSKAESGEIKIPTVLDIQANMDKNLSDLRDLALLNSGLLSEEQEKAIKIRLGIEVEGDVNTDGLDEDINNAVSTHTSSSGVEHGGSGGSFEVETDVEIKAGEVNTSDVEETVKNEVKTGAEGQKNYRIGVSPDIKVDPEVDASGAEEKIEEKTEEAVNNQSGKTETVEKEVELELSIGDYIDNLSEFEDVAKKISELDGDISATVTANIEGNVLGAEGDINKLVTFADGAKELEGTESSYITVHASLEGNVTDKNNLKNLETFAKGAKELDGAKSSYITVSANLEGNIDDLKNIGNLKTFAEGAKALDGAKSSNITVSANVGGNIDSVKNIGNLEELAAGAKELDKVKNKDISIKVTADVDGNIDSLKNLDNLTELAAGAKELDGLKNKDVNVSVTANFEGSLKDTKNIEDLAVFVQGAQDLQKVESSEVTITANINGSALDFSSEQLANLTTLADGAKELGKIKNTNIDISVNADLTGELDAGKVNELKDFAAGAKDLGALKEKDVNVSVTANLQGEISWSGTIAELGQFATHAKALQGVESKEVTVTANIAGNVNSDNINNLSQFASIVNTLPSKDVNIGVKASVDTASVNNAITVLKSVSDSGLFKDYTSNISVNYTLGEQAPPVDKEALVNYALGEQAPPVEKTVKVNYSLGTQALPKNKTALVNYLNPFGTVSGTANANGTASGRAFARGNWGIKGNGVALGGELGRELVVRDGKFFTIGDDGAEFFRYKKNDIVFNAAQTESLFKYGGIKGANPRGKMLASGSAFVSGTAFPNGSTGDGGGFWTNPVTGTTYGKSNSKDAAEDFEETLDWIEIAISRIEREIDNLDKIASNVYISWDARNESLFNKLYKVRDEINLQQQAYSKYMEAANGVGLDESWASKVRNGEINIETITDETLKEKIADYQKYYEAALECQDAIIDLKEEESDFFTQRFENITAQYDSYIKGFEHTEAMLNEYISQAEEKGHIVSKKYYQELINNEKSNIGQLEKKRANLIRIRDDAVANGAITIYSEEWYNMCAEIDDVTQSIEESTTALLEFDNAMRDIDFSIFDLIQERISAVSEEADFLIELMSNEKLFDDSGKLTSQGLATMGLHAQNYNTHMYQADEYGAEVDALNTQIANDPYDQELINRRNELLELQRESILAAEDEKNAIRDMVEEGINLELDALQELIDKKNEELESERDLYEYQKKVKEQTKEIASLEKQMAAYSGDDSEEAKQKIQQIKVDLESARQDLQETEYDKFISDTSSLLDTLYTEYELILNTRLDNIDYLLESVIGSINAATSADGNIATALGSEGAIAIAVSNNATSIKDTLISEAKNVGATLSSAMNNIWSVGEGNAKSVLTMYGEDFRTKSAAIITTLNDIKSSVNSMLSSTDKEAKEKIAENKTATSAKKDPTKTPKLSKKVNKVIKRSSGDGKPKIGDKVTFVSGQYYYDSQGKKPLGSKYRGKQVYITNINNKDWATHGYHISTGNKLGSGDLGWLKLNQLSGYAIGKQNFLNDEIAWTQEDGKEFIVRPSDGAILTPIAKGDSVLTSTASSNIWDMANSPAEFIKNNLNLGAANVPNNSNVQSNYIQNFENITFSMPNVHGYSELLTEMQRDKNFEKLILSMTIDRIAGKSSLVKGKSIK